MIDEYGYNTTMGTYAIFVKGSKHVFNVICSLFVLSNTKKAFKLMHEEGATWALHDKFLVPFLQLCHINFFVWVTLLTEPLAHRSKLSCVLLKTQEYFLHYINLTQAVSKTTTLAVILCKSAKIRSIRMISKSMQAEWLLESLPWQTQSEVKVRPRLYRSDNGITNVRLSK